MRPHQPFVTGSTHVVGSSPYGTSGDSKPGNPQGGDTAVFPGWAWIIYEDVLDSLENRFAAAFTQKVVGIALTEGDAARAVAAGGKHSACRWPPVEEGKDRRSSARVPIVNGGIARPGSP